MANGDDGVKADEPRDLDHSSRRDTLCTPLLGNVQSNSVVDDKILGLTRQVSTNNQLANSNKSPAARVDETRGRANTENTSGLLFVSDPVEYSLFPSRALWTLAVILVVAFFLN